MNEVFKKITSDLRHGKIPLKDECLNEHPEEADLIKNLFDFHYLNNNLSNDFEEIILRENNVLTKTSLGNLNSEINTPLEVIDLSFELLALEHHVYWNEKNPFQSFMAKINNQNLRVSMLHKSAGPKSHQYFLRSSHSKFFELKTYLSRTDIITQLVTAKSNFIIAGASGSGKTSFLNSIISQVPNDENIIAIEDLKEIHLKQPHSSRLISKDSNTLKDFCNYALRMNPDRVILGEIRSKEIVPLILAVNSGVKGVLSTIHANSATDAVDRMAQLFELFSESKNITFNQVIKFIVNNIDFIFYLENKKVVELIKLKNVHKGEIIFDEIPLL